MRSRVLVVDHDSLDADWLTSLLVSREYGEFVWEALQHARPPRPCGTGGLQPFSPTWNCRS